ncbi:FadR family transcriptional regulator [Aestuariicella hydrocarbonica]|uniref:FadR family transcriptional regulator n=1 Tax=Pseudomaricurvus hydrocarbonicus TaxID=1470433 RepID=A0A9E5MM78_9GAMM|nr:GntR family transcriptional regulator [Aestuariicella hydrocarbonica]NHO65660.1 FadR family transcriptional regulator [Aestuariicella hydrocarbonica]
MSPKQAKNNMNTAAQELRDLIWNRSDGDLLGSEDDLTDLLRVSRPTVRQVARLLEREGLLKVKRGINGGYFASRPSVEVIENSVSAYLKMLDVDTEDVTEIASVMWMTIVKKAASSPTEETRQLMAKLRSDVLSVTDEATFDDILAIEEENRREIFKLINSPYIELIFHINRTFTFTQFPSIPASLDGSEEHREFVRAWRKAKLLEIEAISEGDVALGEMVARHNRNLFHKRLWGHGRL